MNLDNEEEKYREALRKFEKDLMPTKFTDPKTLIKKYGDDINDDLILSIVHNIEDESVKCAKIQAFNAASALIASAIEGILYHACSGDTTFIGELINYNKGKIEKSIEELHFNG